jgi:hypothetical protein
MSPIESISIPEASEAGPPLNCEERIRLAQLETLIQGSLEKFLLAGRALLEIKTRRLYRQEYSTFQDYCMKCSAISERRGLDLVRSTAVAENLLAGPADPNGDAPLPPDLSENVMRPLAKLPPQLQVECWRLASHLTEKRLTNPESFVAELRKQRGRPDLFTFMQPVGDQQPHHPFYHEPESLAVLRITTYREGSAHVEIRPPSQNEGPLSGWWPGAISGLHFATNRRQKKRPEFD